MTRKRECPRCHHELDTEDLVCPNCGLFFEAGESYDEASYSDEQDLEEDN